MFEQVTIIAFDLDDTLWPCMPVIERAEQDLYGWLAQHCPRITENNDPAQLVQLRREFSGRDPLYAIDMTLMRQDFLRHLGDAHGYDGELISQRGFEVFFAARQRVQFFHDVLPSLERLKRRFRLGAISNGNASVDQVGLGHLFEHAVSASDVRVAKPDPRIYGHLAERFSAAPEEIVYVGDHPVYDVLGAVDAGYHAVWINREQTAWPEDLPPPPHQVRDLHELESLLNG